jgi:hypothetical protein
MTTYEFRRVENPLEADLNKLGQEGWQLVSVLSEASHSSYGGAYCTVAWLQREQKQPGMTYPELAKKYDLSDVTTEQANTLTTVSKTLFWSQE